MKTVMMMLATALLAVTTVTAQCPVKEQKKAEGKCDKCECTAENKKPDCKCDKCNCSKKVSCAEACPKKDTCPKK